MTPSGSSSIRDAMTQVGALGALNEEELERLAPFGRLQTLARGETLLRKGDPADTLYFVVDGKFAVFASPGQTRIGEIGRGEPAGEVAFFRGGARTADVVAIRNALVLSFHRSQLEDIVRNVPNFAAAILNALAARLAAATQHISSFHAHVIRGSYAIASVGAGGLPENFIHQLAAALGEHGSTRIFRSQFLCQQFGEWMTASANDVTAFVESAERETDFCLFECEDLPAPLAQILVKACDGLVFAARAQSGEQLSYLESFAQSECAGAPVRLALLHDSDAAIYAGTARWLKDRSVLMHHHIGPGAAGMQRLARFMAGRASGFAASGGGAACAAQIGVYRAFRERGVRFDYWCGTSGGAAMSAAFAHDLDPQEIGDRLHDMFVTRGALSRLTLPRYSLLDHRPFDAALRAHYGETCIEDLAVPFFAVSTNLSTGSEYLHHTGPVWQAIRASGAIPGLLPPFYTEQGDMLVDGCLVDNLPIARLRKLKAGPNVAAALRMPERRGFNVDYDDLPSGWKVASSLVSGFMGGTPSKAPSIAEVLTLSLTLSRDMRFPADGVGEDVLFLPPIPADMAFTQWARHRELADGAWRYAGERIDQLSGQGDHAIAAILACAEPKGR